MRVGGSCHQADSFGSGQVKAVSDEFHEDCGFRGSCEKFREGIAKGNGYDLFRGGQPWPNGADPGAEGLPYQVEFRHGEDLKQALGDESELDVAMVGRDLAADGITVDIRFAVQVLVAAHAS